MKSLFSTALLAAALVALANPNARAQAPDEGGPNPGGTAPTNTPLDGGVSLLLAGGAAYAFRRLRRLSAR